MDGHGWRRRGNCLKRGLKEFHLVDIWNGALDPKKQIVLKGNRKTRAVQRLCRVIWLNLRCEAGRTF